MKKAVAVGLAVLMAAAITPAFAELQNVEVGGEVRVRFNAILNNYNKPLGMVMRIPAGRILGRPVGIFNGPPTFNGPGILSFYSWDSDGGDLNFVEQRTKLHVKADFTDEVTAFIEFDSYDIWGEDFRSNYVTGVDGRAASVDDVELNQAYIEARNMWGTPLTLRVGRQELSFGDQWLVGPKDFGPNFVGRSFDAVRLTYAGDSYSIDAFASKLAENFGDFGDNDVDFYGVYASCTALENVTFDVYWFLLRDDRPLNDTVGTPALEWAESLLGVDNYDTTNLNTVGFRAAGHYAAFDYSVQGAYQFGDAGQQGFGFKPYRYGDDDAKFDVFGAKIVLGYTFDAPWAPRIHADYSYYGGEDNRDITLGEWLNPFHKPQASVSFNRLFSNQMYNGSFDLHNDLSNVHIFRIGGMAHPRPNLHLILDLTYFLADKTFDRPSRFGVFPFMTDNADDNLGWAVDVAGIYNFTEDLTFWAHYSLLLVDDGLQEGSFNGWNGLLFAGGTDDDPVHYLNCEFTLKF